MNHNELKYKLLVKRKTNVFYSGLNANTTKSLFRVGMMLCGSGLGCIVIVCFSQFSHVWLTLGWEGEATDTLPI